MFGTHEAKYQLKGWVEANHVTRIERFTQAIGDSPYSELELAMPGESIDEQLASLSHAFVQFTGAPLAGPVVEQLRGAGVPGFALGVRIRGGKIVRVGALAPGIALGAIEALCRAAKVGSDDKLGKLVGALGEGIARVEYGRAGERAGVDVYLEPGEPAAKPAKPAASDAN
jgi:hypothetical protein